MRFEMVAEKAMGFALEQLDVVQRARTRRLFGQDMMQPRIDPAEWLSYRSGNARTTMTGLCCAGVVRRCGEAVPDPKIR